MDIRGGYTSNLCRYTQNNELKTQRGGVSGPPHEAEGGARAMFLSELKKRKGDKGKNALRTKSWRTLPAQFQNGERIGLFYSFFSQSQIQGAVWSRTGVWRTFWDKKDLSLKWEGQAPPRVGFSPLHWSEADALLWQEGSSSPKFTSKRELLKLGLESELEKHEVQK